jgi:hypothetical protein
LLVDPKGKARGAGVSGESPWWLPYAVAIGCAALLGALLSIVVS